MTLNEYQTKAMTTCMPTCDNLSYMLLNLTAEVGEFCGHLAKGIRKGQYSIVQNTLRINLEAIPLGEETTTICNLRKEAGDILWQLAGLCSTMGWTLEEIAKENLQKLASRQQRGVIDGNGDNR